MARTEHGRPHLVEENERADHRPRAGRQDAADLETTEITRAWNDHGFDRIIRCTGHRSSP
jgi:hypothetical protein